jgi:hypothetical protein
MSLLRKDLSGGRLPPNMPLWDNGRTGVRPIGSGTVTPTSKQEIASARRRFAMFIDKKHAARLLTNASIRSVFSGECPVANHVVIMSSRQILHEYADAHRISLMHDMRTHVKDKSLVREFEFLWKQRYNFLKHADKDHDREINIRNVNFLNDFEILLNAEKYREMFSEMSAHMAIFKCFIALMYPGKMKIDAHLDAKHSISETLRKVGAGMSRQAICDIFDYGLRTDLQARAEIEEARELSFKRPAPYSEDERATVEISRKRNA